MAFETGDDQTVWNKKYAEAPEKWLEPDPFLIEAYREFLRDVPPGSALDLAGGAGRHAIWLASRGWKVKIADISDVGLALARQNAIIRLGESCAERLITLEQADLNNLFDLGQEQFDLIVVVRYLNRQLFPAIARALNAAGTLIYSTYTIEQQRFECGPHDPRVLLNPGELRQAFPGLQVLHYKEKIGSKALAELVARKPGGE